MYPTPEEIEKKMETLPDYSELADIFKDFQKTYPKKGSSPAKKLAISWLIRNVNTALGGKRVWVICQETPESARYIPSEHTIVLSGNASIITGLHELAHHLYGSSELMACAFSIKLFSTFFPNARKKLVWDGHMLIKAP